MTKPKCSHSQGLKLRCVLTTLETQWTHTHTHTHKHTPIRTHTRTHIYCDVWVIIRLVLHYKIFTWESISGLILYITDSRGSQTKQSGSPSEFLQTHSFIDTQNTQNMLKVRAWIGWYSRWALFLFFLFYYTWKMGRRFMYGVMWCMLVRASGANKKAMFYLQPAVEASRSARHIALLLVHTLIFHLLSLQVFRHRHADHRAHPELTVSLSDTSLCNARLDVRGTRLESKFMSS